MIDVFAFITFRSLRNRYARRIKRLREPRYLLPFAISLLWFGTAVLRPFTGGHGGRVIFFSPGMLGADVIPAIEFLAGVGIFLWVAMLWLLPSKTAELVFSDAEIHFLFTAPVTRRQIVQYKIARAQIGIGTGAVIGALVFGAHLGSLEGWARVVAFWLFFAIGYLHGIAASFVRTDLLAAGWSGVRRRGFTLLVVGVTLGAVAFGARHSWVQIANAAADLVNSGGKQWLKQAETLVGILAAASTTGVGGVILWPFMVLPRLLFARDVGTFLRTGGVGLVILAVHYVWVLRTDASFEEASVELAQRMSMRKQARGERLRTGGILVKRAKGFVWKLSPQGRPAVALIWKNLVNLTRVTPVRALIGLAAFVFGMMSISIQFAHARSNLWLLAAWMAALIAAFTSLLGPTFVRNDLREDLFRIDVIRTFPLAGHAVILAEVLGAWIVLALIQLAAIVASLFALAMSGAAQVDRWSVSWMLGGLACATLVLPAFTLVAVALQNALVVLFPAWVQLGNSRARGFEASGQRILTLLATFLTMSVVALPALASGGVLAYVLILVVGPLCLAPAGIVAAGGAARLLFPLCLFPGGVVAAAWMALEVWLGCRLLGRVLDRIDPSTAGIEAQEA